MIYKLNKNKYNYLSFIHLPKTGGSSIKNSLLKNCEIKFSNPKDFKKNLSLKFLVSDQKINEIWGHIPMKYILNKNLKKNFVFTFIRNPFSRAVSLYYQIKLETKQTNFIKKKYKINIKKFNFEYFLNFINDNNYWFTLPMIDWVGKENISKLNFIGKLENFEKDNFTLKKKLKLDFDINFHNINSKYQKKYKPFNYLSYYNNKKLISLVEKKYSEDMKIFDYSFEKFLNFQKKQNFVNLLIKKIKRKIYSVSF